MSKLIRPLEVTELVGFKKTKLWEMVKANKFPQPLKLSDRMTAFDYDEVQAWIHDKLASRMSTDSHKIYLQNRIKALQTELEKVSYE